MVQKKQAFTLVELIVTIVILAILGAIAFISFQGYSRNTRDSARIADINLVQKSLAIFITKTGFYPTPDNSQTITYEGGTAWIEGVIGENVIKNIQSVSKKPIDPLTSDEFTYSVTASKTEYQLGAISEMSISLNNGINQSYAADISKAKALIRGTYNEKFLKVETGGIQMLLVQPSIIVTDIGDPDLTRLIQNKKVVYNNYDNIPHSYNHNSSMTGGFDYEPGRGGDIVVLSGTTLTLSGNEDKIAFIGNVQDVLSGTILDGGEEYTPILDLDSTDSTGAVLLVDNYITNKIGGVTGDLSGLVGNTNGGGSTGGDCSLTQTELDELNLYYVDGTIDAYDAYWNEIVMNNSIKNLLFNKVYAGGATRVNLTEDQWCNTVASFDWYGGTTLPDGLWKLTNVQYLGLGRVGLTDIPSGIGSLTNLLELNISNNNLTSLPTELGNLTYLNSLDISDNSLTSLPTTIGNLNDLQQLSLSYNNISSLPTTIGNLSSLTSIDLNHNKLTEIPIETYNLTSLLYFDFSNNLLTDISTNIGNLTNLKQIWLTNNSLTSVPTTIGNLTNLEWVYINLNDITSIPTTIGNLVNLLDLNLSDNNISSLPSSIGGLTKVINFLADHNSLTSLPVEIGNLTSLSVLSVGYNSISSLPTEIGNLTNLTQLGLHYNSLTTLPSSIGNLTKLYNLQLTSNSLTTLPQELTSLIVLQVLNLSGNSSLGNLSYLFLLNTSSRSQLNIPTTGKTMTIRGNGTYIVITVTP
ncbi:MAG: prepilin-type N-terminal cleavage/methylation domain-containing protein [Candidatus Gracilibacteria bacterium]|nr:prepilin-type N-terminal cleavage/methylation domain-containing protein [Candidatus Gracilibacteria bacterium]